MFIITGGCSFTAHLSEESLSWANQLAEMPDYYVINTAQMASGNSLISRNVLQALSKNYQDNPKVIVMWSNPNRFELFYGAKHPIQKEMQNDGAFYNNMWLKTGGGYGIWEYKSKIANTDMKTYLKHFHNEEYQLMQTLENILRVQWFCKCHNLQLINLLMQNIFYGYNEILGSSTKKDGELFSLIDSYPSVQHLWDMIDWNTWHLYNDTGGILEFCFDKGYDIENGLHPNREAQCEYLNEIVIPLLRQ